MEYFIVVEGAKQGPFDIVSMIRKIRNGQLLPDSLITDTAIGDPVPAMEFSNLREVFEEQAVIGNTENTQPVHTTSITFKSLFERAKDFLDSHSMGIPIAGGFILTIIIAAFAIKSLIPIDLVHPLIASIIGYFIFMLMQASYLRMVRMQPLSIGYIISTLKRYGVSMFVVSIIVGITAFGIPAIASSFSVPLAIILLFIPGTLITCFTYFAALLIIDRGFSPMQGISSSAAFLKKLGGDNIVTIYTLILINYIAAAPIIFLLITLPLTVAVLNEVYDDNYSAMQS